MTWAAAALAAESIPLAEHPRPDFQRSPWLNLNGSWQFRFDADNQGLEKEWFQAESDYPLAITVPFPWGSALSGVADEADIGWYARPLRVPADWRGQRVFLVIGACDWHTTAWLDGKPLGEHQGGYTPFAFDLTPQVRFGQPQRLVLRVDDSPHPFKLEGKQGYGRAAGIWQTVYLEARPSVALETIHFSPDIDAERVRVQVELDQPAPKDCQLRLKFNTGDLANPVVTRAVDPGAKQIDFTLPVPRPRLWTLEDPFLYEVEVSLLAGPAAPDRVSTYFGMRKISVTRLPGTEIPYVALNNKPLYLQMTLDQAYHPEGFYAYPSDAFMRDEILRSRRIGLNCNRIHIKVEVPRKLYWADRLGLLIMADVPNSWGPPEEKMRTESEYALRRMIHRDYNHPAIFCWVNFNETWGLFTDRNGRRRYLPETQEWVASMYKLTKQLDPTRLVEDNSPCNNDHVATDLNTWHAYLPGYAWREQLDQICRDTFAGSKWNFIGGRTQGDEPMLNSECGNVWGYKGSTGDVDWSWDYHIMINEFRRHPKVCGWLYTEHHDVINEWNGYYRYDRSEKYTGLEELVEQMSLRDLHGAVYVTVGDELCRQVKPQAEIEVPLYASFLTNQDFGPQLHLNFMMYGWDELGRRQFLGVQRQTVAYRPWMCQELPPVRVTMPQEETLVVLALQVEDAAGTVLHRNFTTFLATDDTDRRERTVKQDDRLLRLIRFAPDSFARADWSLGQWNVLGGLKVNGAGSGFFEYEIPWPKDLDPARIQAASVRAELSAKQLFGKDQKDSQKQEGDFMRGKGTHDPSLNPNAYPMTDETTTPGSVRILANGRTIGRFDLPDDPADHRGILSWLSQKRDRTLTEAGSYGYLITAAIPLDICTAAKQSGRLILRFEADPALAGGLAIYGKRFGRFPLDPTLIFTLQEQ
ncbi:MAG: hypothetical protein JW810_06175 [Sedimentisphaerales bacterium]|nr:hypothetical protein [Sedimentisphaerales bacterium]